VKYISVFLLAVFLGACATEEVIAPDTTPKTPTVVLNAKGTINGYVFPDFNFKQIVYTREDKRTIAMDAEYESWSSRQFLGDPDETVIFRMDKSLRWVMSGDKKEKKYVECPLSGCGFKLLAQLDKKQDNQNEDQFDYDPNAEAECGLTLKKIALR